MNTLDQRAFSVSEIWQSQSYWPIKGWAAPTMGSVAHYSGSLLIMGAEVFPDNLSPPPGWEWSDKWSIDCSPRYGQPDADGWYYASSFDRLNDLIKSGTAVGAASKTSLVRKRRWIRPMNCVSEELLNQLKARSDRIIQLRCSIEVSLREKETVLNNVVAYEVNRSFVFAKSLQLATQGTLNTLGIVKDLSGKLKLLKQFLIDRAAMDLEYAKRLETLSVRYSGLADGASGGDSSNGASPVKLLENSAATPLSVSPHSRHTPSFTDEVPRVAVSDSSSLFFTNASFLNKGSAGKLRSFSLILTDSLVEDVDAMFAETQTILKDSRVIFRKNSDICRLSEGAVKNCYASVKYAYESVVGGSLQEISRLSDELNSLKGGQSVDMQSLQSRDRLSSAIAGAQREDLWLSVQRYRQVVRGTQEALCVLIAASMDLELQQQIISNKAHRLFVAVAKTYSGELQNLLSETHCFATNICTDTVASMVKLGPPNPVLQSPFSKLQEKVEDAEQETQGAAVVGDQDYLNSTGIFAFTCLYKAALPPASGVVRSGEFMVAKADDFLRSSNVLFGGIWKTVHAIATTDGYLHLLGGAKSDMPERSFCIQQCEVLPLTKDLTNAEYHHLMFEVRPHAIAPPSTNSSAKHSPAMNSGIFLKASDETTVREWVELLLAPLGLQEASVDQDVERETALAMLESLPILKGESSKISRELQRLEELSLGQEWSDSPQDLRSDKGPSGRSDEFGLSLLSADEMSASTQDSDDETAAGALSEGIRTLQSSGERKSRQGHSSVHAQMHSITPISVGRSNSLYGFGSQYRKGSGGTDSWVKSEAAESLDISASERAKPKQIIPVVSKDTPLAKRHSYMISQYEQGLLEEKQRVTLKVSETKGNRLKDFGATAGASTAGSSSGDKVPLVKRISQKYSSAAALSVQKTVSEAPATADSHTRPTSPASTSRSVTPFADGGSADTATTASEMS